MSVNWVRQKVISFLTQVIDLAVFQVCQANVITTFLITRCVPSLSESVLTLVTCQKSQCQANGVINLAGIYTKLISIIDYRLDTQFRLQDRKHMIATPIENIAEDGIDPKRFVTVFWTEEIRTTPIKVVVRDQVLKLMPSLKIEDGVAINKVTQAFDIVETLYAQACKKRKDPEKAYLKIIKTKPHRIACSEEFVDLADSNNHPKSR